MNMPRTQAIVLKNKKNVQPAKAKKTKGTKFDGDKAKETKGVEIGKSAIKPRNQKPIQGQAKIDDVSSSPKPNYDLGDKKLERANSFFLTRQLTKIYDSLTSSKESLKGNEEASGGRTAKPPFKFIRSVSLAAISLKKDYRGSMRAPKLEQLSEEDHPSLSATTETSKRKYDKKATASTDSLLSRSSDKSSVFSSFKRTFSLRPSRRKSSNPKWSASLMSLQQIDVMISYEDLSFIDYDKFNTYEESLMTRIKSANQIDANPANAERFPGVKMRSKSNNVATQRRHSAVQQGVNPATEANQWLNASKRWSNPCDVPNTDRTPFSSCASIAMAPSTVDITDCPANIFAEISATSRIDAHSVDDLTQKPNEATNYALQIVSDSPN